MPKKGNDLLEYFSSPNSQLYYQGPSSSTHSEMLLLLHQKEKRYRRNPDVFSQHPKLEKPMRSVVLDWMMDVCAEKRLHRETFHLCVDFFDRYLDRTHDLDSSKLQLIASAALAIATKIEEIYPPKLSEIADYTDESCSDEDIRDLEQVMLQALDWNFVPITAIHWLSLYLQLMDSDATPTIPKAIYNFRVERLSAQHSFIMPAQTMLNSSFNLSLNHSIDSGIGTCSSATINDSNDRESDIMHELSCFDTTYNSRVASCDEHIFPEQRYMVPKLMRDEFIRLAKILDLSLLDPESLNFTYSELAAAVISCCYEPDNSLCQITDFDPEQLQKPRLFMEPFVRVCDKTSPTGTTIPYYSEVISFDRHNIQTYMQKNIQLLEEANNISISAKKKKVFGTVKNYN